MRRNDSPRRSNAARKLSLAGLALAGLASLAMVACATVERFESVQARWVGHPIADYLADTGLTPAEVIAPEDSAEDGAVYVFSYARRYQSPGRTPETSATIDRAGTFPANPYPYVSVPIEQHCTWTYRTDAAGIIRAFAYEGNACRQ